MRAVRGQNGRDRGPGRTRPPGTGGRREGTRLALPLPSWVSPLTPRASLPLRAWASLVGCAPSRPPHPELGQLLHPLLCQGGGLITACHAFVAASGRVVPGMRDRQLSDNEKGRLRGMARGWPR
ncbi:DUF6192 family protein [Streptomyces sp. NPDC023588]|uniref:DUF6192 family protein n=1 Tax=Streptomyces sp. NPDC023588 TaxID=3154907 RepID=UPI0033DD266B